MKPVMKHFSGLHPAVQFLYFAAVIVFSMFLLHPIFLVISLACGFACSTLLNPGKAVGFVWKMLLPLILIMTIVNPFLNHNGATILLYVNDNPLTLEAIVYGFAAALMFASVLLWFSCSNAVMTSDKFIELFGRVVPSLSLIFSMVMRFVPRFKAQVKVLADAQKGIGRGVDTGSILMRAKNGMKMLSMLTTWALENGVITADSMRARGCGLPKRSSFRRHSFDSRDKCLFILLIVLILAVIWGISAGAAKYRYFPIVFIETVTPAGLTVFAAYFLLCAFPLWVGAVFEGLYHGNF
jgi:ABC-type cobalt transport system, permease component CbiQ and related transporters